MENIRQIFVFLEKSGEAQDLTNYEKGGIIFKTQMKMQGRKDEEYERENY